MSGDFSGVDFFLTAFFFPVLFFSAFSFLGVCVRAWEKVGEVLIKCGRRPCDSLHPSKEKVSTDGRVSSDANPHSLPKIFLLVVQRQFAVVMRSAYQFSVIMCFLGKEDSTYDANNAGANALLFFGISIVVGIASF